MRPLAADICCGLGGWAQGLVAEGFRVRGYDIVDMFAEIGEPKPEHFELVIQDVRTLHGSALRDAELIVASPPCTEFSYMAMPFGRGKQIARALRRQDEFPAGYRGSRTIEELTALFDACFRIQREASEAAGRYIPMVVENVRGAEPWVGKAKWNFGSYYLWGDVPALMPPVIRAQKFNPDGTAHGQGSWFAIADSKERGARKNGELGGGSWFNIGSPGQKVVGVNPDGRKNPGFRFDGSGRSFQSESVARHVEGVKAPSGAHVRDGAPHTARLTSPVEGRKGGGDWFGAGEDCSLQRRAGSKSPARKAASARIAKIPAALAQHIARTYLPESMPHPARIVRNR